MALRVWLPLNGNINNYGISDLTFTNTSTSMITINNSGKIGKCYSFNSTSSNNGIYGADITSQYINNKSWSLCAWVKTTASDTCVMSLSYGLRLFAGSSIYVTLYNSSRTINCQATGKSTTDGLWHHIVAAYDHILNKIYIFVDGLLINTVNYTSGYTYASSWNNGTFIGKDPNNSTVSDHYLYKGLMNDVRIYDHCLSPKEVKEISKGLCLHYKLDGVCNTIDSTEWDCSGFGNNGTKSGSITVSNDTGRYSSSYKFDTTSSKIKLPAFSYSGLANSYSFAWWQKNTSSGNMPWGFSDGNRLNLYHTTNLCWNTGDGGGNPFKDSSGTAIPNTRLCDSIWHHCVVTGNGSTTKLYIDGIYAGAATTYKAITGTQIYISGWDTSTSYTFSGSNLSDFRIYATVLSDADIKELYNTPLSIDNVGNMYTYEFKEIE